MQRRTFSELQTERDTAKELKLSNYTKVGE
jgi:hypothetical protein